ncbi:MAG: hypothetical protein KAJ86_08370 [Alphaproteobacteria bacterium]|nr:hypothetical protein [Alphaproteobacteria bacterium]
MFNFNIIKSNSEKVLSNLENFELFCIGEKELSPQEFTNLNKELSISAIKYIGQSKFCRKKDGKHLIWIGLDNQEHDLGKVNAINITKDYPGFHKSRSLSLGHDHVTKNDVVDIPKCEPMNIVKMDDGSTGIAPNYKMALRNASLKMHLKHTFNSLNYVDAWMQFYGHA